MIAYVKGTLEIKMTGYVIIDVAGIGYKIFMSDSAMDKLGNIGDVVKVHTYYRVREDDISLFGFNTIEELRMFELLIGVSGIGAKTALSMLAVVEPSNFALAVISNDIATLTKIPGIGAKSAQRIVLELKDKLKTEQAINKDMESGIKNGIVANSVVEEAVSALQVLGYNKREIEKALESVKTDSLKVEEIIKKGLLALSKE